MRRAMRELSFGILGLSPGNGHPYSWSAIFNGYDRDAMATCPFPVIPAYLAERTFPDDAIAGARVTHVWTQDRAVSEHVAQASRIDRVVDRPEDMIGSVDGVLLARDDAERHPLLAAPFLDAGLPIYIDKPLALSGRDARKIYARQARPGQIFTCSALAFAAELSLTARDKSDIGRLRYAEAVTAKDWGRYAVHVIEPLLTLAADEGGLHPIVGSGAGPRHPDMSFQAGVLAP
ncbi:Gfo/Idh/MocA family oxidoreductase, partial [Nostoc sp. NIES-2111]